MKLQSPKSKHEKNSAPQVLNSQVRTPCAPLLCLEVWCLALLCNLMFGTWSFPAAAATAVKRPNILLAIADDASWPHCSAYGCKWVNTPAFDRVAKMGVLFTHAYSPAPGCSPSRAALLTGRQVWQNEQAAAHASSFPRKWPVYTELLEKAGYFVGLTQKGWGPGNFKVDGWPHNPAGVAFDNRMLDKRSQPQGISPDDYAGNFKDFYAAKPKDKPFCFWYGCKEPHRSYEDGSGLKRGKKTSDVVVPSFLPDAELVRSDLLDYAVEIEHFDKHLVLMLKFLEEVGELDNTLIVVTSDNGMSIPRGKANLYDAGTHVPLAIAWPTRVKRGRVIDDFVSHIDHAPTFLEAAGLPVPNTMTGKSLLPMLLSGKSGRVEAWRDRVFTARERHSSARPNNLGYPIRAMQTHDFLYIRNFAPDRWPAGDPGPAQKSKTPYGYYDIDDGPTKKLLVQEKEKYPRFFDLAVAKRPAEELYDAKIDPGNIHNLANDPRFAEIKRKLAAEFEAYLKKTGDPRVLGNGDVFESYPRFGEIRNF